MALIILAIERQKNKEIDTLCAEYVSRLGHFIPTKIKTIPNSKIEDPEKQKVAETTALLKQVKPSDTLILCDEFGQTHTSKSFSKFIEKQLVNSRGDLIFVIGGSYGFDREQIKSYPSIKLSEFVLPHHLARLVLTEQLYRAFTIIRNTGYHH